MTFVDPDDPGNFERAIRPNTKILYGETLGNPDIKVFPFEEVAAIAKAHAIPLMIDNTFATPYLCRPFEWGANIVTHSTTKFLGGHGQAIGGVIVDGGNFDWRSGRFANFTTPDPSYHGLVYADVAGMGLPPFIIKARVQILRDIGACQAPFNSWNTLTGVETLSLRMERHCANAQRVAEFLDEPPGGRAGSATPASPAIPTTSGPRSTCPRAWAPSWASASRAASRPARSFIDSLKLFSHLANVGDAKSLAIHPASTTHSQLTADEMVSGRRHPRLHPPERRPGGHRGHPVGPGAGVGGGRQVESGK